MISRTIERALDAVQSRVALRAASQIGAGVRIFGWPRVANEGHLVIGAGAVLVSRPAPVQIVVDRGAAVTVGEQALVESGATLRARYRVSIGARARIGAGCVVDDEGQEATEIIVGDAAWIEDGAILLAGARVPAGARIARTVVGAGRPVTVGKPTGNGHIPDSLQERVRKVLGRIVPAVMRVDVHHDLNGVRGWDSLSALRALVALEKEFSVVLPQDLFASKPRIDSILQVVSRSVFTGGGAQL
jgi:maltose O-acetyltransferase